MARRAYAGSYEQLEDLGRIFRATVKHFGEADCEKIVNHLGRIYGWAKSQPKIKHPEDGLYARLLGDLIRLNATLRKVSSIPFEDFRSASGSALQRVFQEFEYKNELAIASRVPFWMVFHGDTVEQIRPIVLSALSNMEKTRWLMKKPKTKKRKTIASLLTPAQERLFVLSVLEVLPGKKVTPLWLAHVDCLVRGKECTTAKEAERLCGRWDNRLQDVRRQINNKQATRAR